jgi:hypothetical protein
MRLGCAEAAAQVVESGAPIQIERFNLTLEVVDDWAEQDGTVDGNG